MIEKMNKIMQDEATTQKSAKTKKGSLLRPYLVRSTFGAYFKNTASPRGA